MIRLVQPNSLKFPFGTLQAMVGVALVLAAASSSARPADDLLDCRLGVEDGAKRRALASACASFDAEWNEIYASWVPSGPEAAAIIGTLSPEAPVPPKTLEAMSESHRWADIQLAHALRCSPRGSAAFIRSMQQRIADVEPWRQGLRLVVSAPAVNQVDQEDLPPVLRLPVTPHVYDWTPAYAGVGVNYANRFPIWVWENLLLFGTGRPAPPQQAWTGGDDWGAGRHAAANALVRLTETGGALPASSVEAIDAVLSGDCSDEAYDPDRLRAVELLVRALKTTPTRESVLALTRALGAKMKDTRDLAGQAIRVLPLEGKVPILESELAGVPEGSAERPIFEQAIQLALSGPPPKLSPEEWTVAAWESLVARTPVDHPERQRYEKELEEARRNLATPRPSADERRLQALEEVLPKIPSGHESRAVVEAEMEKLRRKLGKTRSN